MKMMGVSADFFRRRIKAAVYDETAGEWEIESEDGRRYRARFLITAIGPLSAPTMPNIPGVDSFRGEAYHTSRWPHEPVSFVEKRVGVIGTGATAVQAITEIAKTVGHLHQQHDTGLVGRRPVAGRGRRRVRQRPEHLQRDRPD